MALESHSKLIEEYKQRVRKRFYALRAFLLALLAVLVIFDIQVGSSNIDLNELLKALAEGPNGDSSTAFIVWEIRLPMTFTCLFVGASIEFGRSSDSDHYSIIRLASPYTLGVTAGASFGAELPSPWGFAVLGQDFGLEYLYRLFSSRYSFRDSFLLRSRKSLSATTLILVGVIMNFFFRLFNSTFSTVLLRKSLKSFPDGHSATCSEHLGSARLSLP